MTLVNIWKRFSLKVRGCVVVALVVSSCFICGYWEYVTQQKIFFVHAGDALNSHLPGILNLHQLIYQGEFPQWSFNKGLGADVAVGNPNNLGDPYALLLAILPARLIPHAIIYMFLIKIVLSAIVFYFYLCEFKSLDERTKVLGALQYAFCGIVICRCFWFHYITEIFFLPLLLLGLEKWYRHRTNLLVIPIFTFVLCSRFVSYSYVYSIYVWSYLVIRIFWDGNVSLPILIRKLIRFLPAYLLSVLMASVFIVPGLGMFFSSARNPGTSFLNKVISSFSFETSWVSKSAILKMFMPNMTGVFKTSLSNTLEDLCYYVGIVALFVNSFVVFIPANRKKKIIIFVLSLIVLYTISFFPKSFATLFASNGHAKTSSIWISIALILIELYILKCFRYTKKQTIGVFLFLVFVLTFIIVDFIVHNKGIVFFEFVAAICFMLLYLLIFLIFRPDLRKKILIVVCAAEIILVIRFSLVSDGFGQEIITFAQYDEFINKYGSLFANSVSENDFFRIGLEYSQHMNDAMVNDYYGVNLYDSLVNKSLFDLEKFYKIKTSKNEIKDLQKFPGLSSLLSVKYYETHGQNIRNQYVVKVLDKSVIVENPNAVNFGYPYDYAEKVDKIDNLPVIFKDMLMFQEAFVFEDTSADIKSLDYELVTEDLNFHVTGTHDVNIMLNGDYLTTTNQKCVVHRNAIMYRCTGEDPNVVLQLDKKLLPNSLMKFTTSINKKDIQIYFADEDGVFDEMHSIVVTSNNGHVETLIPSYNDREIYYIRIDVGIPGDTIILYDFSLSELLIKKDSVQLKLTGFANLDLTRSSSDLDNFEFVPLNNDPQLVFELSQPVGDALIVQLDVTGVNEGILQLFYSDSTDFNEDDSVLIGLPANGHINSIVTLPNDKEINNIRLDIGNKDDAVKITNLKVFSSFTNSFILANIGQEMTLNFFSNNYIKGYIHIDEPRLIFFSIPWDDGWSIYDNGQKIEKIPMNIAFFGAYLEPGDHEIELRYVTPGLIPGAIISAISIMIYIWLCYINYKTKKQQERCDEKNKK